MQSRATEEAVLFTLGIHAWLCFPSGTRPLHFSRAPSFASLWLSLFRRQRLRIRRRRTFPPDPIVTAVVSSAVISTAVSRGFLKPSTQLLYSISRCASFGNLLHPPPGGRSCFRILRAVTTPTVHSVLSTISDDSPRFRRGSIRIYTCSPFCFVLTLRLRVTRAHGTGACRRRWCDR